MERVAYIQRSHDYYRSLGYEKSYDYAHNEQIPFTPLSRPLPVCRVALITTASFVLLDEQQAPLEKPMLLGSKALEVFSVPSDWPASRIRSTSEDHDRYQTEMADVDAYFPTTRLQELLQQGVVGSLSSDYYRTPPNYSQRKTLKVDAPEIRRRCLDDGVDVALLTPI